MQELENKLARFWQLWGWLPPFGIGVIASYSVLMDLAHDADFVAAHGGPVSALWVISTAIIFGLTFMFASEHVANIVRTYYRLAVPEKEIMPVNDYTMPNWPQSDELNFVMGEDHHINQRKLKNTFSASAKWFEIPERGLYTGTVVFGAPGAAKTSATLKPFLRQCFEFAAQDQQRKPAMLIMDAKAQLVPVVEELAAQTGRSDDLVIIGPRRNFKFNPLHVPHLDERAVAGRVFEILENLQGGQTDVGARWLNDAASDVLAATIGMVRISTGYVTFVDVLQVAQRTVEMINHADSTADARKDYLTSSKKFFAAASARGVSPEEMEKLEYFAESLFSTFANQKEDWRATFISEIRRVGKHFETPANAKLFCSPESELSIASFQDLINVGKVVVLEAVDSIDKELATALGILLKCEFKDVALSRPILVRTQNFNAVRPLVFMIDEYQEFGSAADAQLAGLGRESRVISMYATQSKAALVHRLGEKVEAVLMGAIRNKIFLGLENPDEHEWASKVCGLDWDLVESKNVQEQVQNAKISSVGKYLGDASTVAEGRSLQNTKIARWEPVDFSELALGQAIIRGFDGVNRTGPKMVYLKFDHLPREMPYKQQIKTFGVKQS